MSTKLHRRENDRHARPPESAAGKISMETDNTST